LGKEKEFFVSRTKTKDALMSLSPEESSAVGLEVERLIKNEMSYIVNRYLNKYKAAAFSTFGWEKEDLLQHIRIILWKGVVTFDASMNFKMTTYLSKILYYQMGNFSKTCQNKKNSQSKLYCPSVLFESEEIIDFNSAEDWAVYSRKFKVLLTKLSKKDMKILVSYLIYGHSISDMETKLNIKKPEVVAALKRIKEKMDVYL
jgi:RNA polymerase sigma factor (sigma-70 family)